MGGSDISTTWTGATLRCTTWCSTRRSSRWKPAWRRIAGLVRSLGATPESRQQVRDRALSSRVRSALAAHPDTRKYRLSVDADRGVIRLEGTAALERAAEVARTVPGVVDVKSQLLEVPPIPPFVA